MRKFLTLLISLAVAMGIGLIAAPAASATPKGCGDLTNGQLCVNKLSSTAAGDFETLYWRHGGKGSIEVKLGVQFKNSSGKIYGIDWLATRTVKSGGLVKAKRYFTTDPGWCVRGTMVSGDSATFITKWLCY